jgi:DNA-binding IscR family transcriptional regulator
MRFSKRSQYALLLVPYLSRAGKASLSTVSANLRLSKPFLEQVAGALVNGGVLGSHRGSLGGYSVKGEPSVGQTLAAIGEYPALLFGAEKAMYRRHTAAECRTMFALVGSLSSAMDIVLNRKVKNLGLELAANENALLSSGSYNLERMN